MLPPEGQRWFSHIAGTLGYISEHVRPDISYAVNVLRRYQGKATVSHKGQVKRVLRYLRGTMDTALQYTVGTVSDQNVVVAYADASFAESFSERRSTTGFVLCMNRGAILWRSKRQRLTALSTSEAEYVALSDAAREIIWSRRFLNEIGFKQRDASQLYTDSQATQAIANSEFPPRSAKHIEVRYHHVRELIRKNEIVLSYIPTESQPADILTKPLNGGKVHKYRK